ncbi:MAG: UPF0262 family protein [Polyangiales bacterium]
MPVDAVVIDERTLERGSEAQQLEWQALIRELLSKAKSGFDERAALHVSVTEQGFALAFQTAEGSNLGEAQIEYERLAELVTEYIDTVRQIAEADGLNHLEALDMAKKVTHDRAGRVLKRELRDFGFDLETSRRLFTLLLSLRIDTTKIVGIHGHRTIR